MWDRTLQVDILQCIVVSLLAAMAIMMIFRSRQLFPWVAGFLAVSIALATPWIWSLNFRGLLPLSLALFLNPHGVSLFPIFPWMCFVLAGGCACHFFLKSADTQKTRQYMRIAACLGILMIACGLLLRNVPYSLPGEANFYTTSPLYLMIRLGSVLLICALLYRLEVKGRWIPRPVQLAGQESLLVYGVHLWLIYALLRGRYLAPILGKQFGYAGCLIISVAIILVMLFLARHWHTLKRNYPDKVRLAQAVIVTIMIAVFILI
jgi:fucose 4-O-acetylase-like acetyltransferase